MKRIGTEKIALLFLITVTVLSSCRREESINDLKPDPVGQELDVQQIRKFVEGSVPKQGIDVKLMATGQAGLRSSDAPIPEEKDAPNMDMDWDNAFTHNNSIKGYPVIMVPLKNNNVNRSIYPDMNPKGFRLLAFQHNEEKEIKWQIFEVHPDENYVKTQMIMRGVNKIENEYSDYLKILNKDFFSGYVFIFHATGSFLLGYHMTNGVYDRKLEPKTLVK